MKMNSVVLDFRLQIQTGNYLILPSLNCPLVSEQVRGLESTQKAHSRYSSGWLVRCSVVVALVVQYGSRADVVLWVEKKLSMQAAGN